MRILGLWVVDYLSGSNSDFFEKAIRKLGYKLDVVPIGSFGTEANLVRKLTEEHYDLLFHVPYMNSPRPELIKSLCDKDAIISLAWNGDDEWLWNEEKGTKEIANSYDWCVTTNQGSIEKYHKSGQKNVILGQWGYSEDWKPKKVKKDYDVYFCGQRNDLRDGYINYLIQNGINVSVDGPGYSGKLQFLEMIDRYRRAKIAINFVNGHRGDFFYQQVKCRNFEVPAVGTFMLSQWCPELDRFFESGKEIETFKTMDEAVEKIRYFLKNDEARENIAALGHRRAKNYSFEKVLIGVFKEIGI